LRTQSRRSRTTWSFGSTMSDCHRLPVPTSNSLAESFGREGFTAVIVASAEKDDRSEGIVVVYSPRPPVNDL
jgi:hypothetical protein